VDSDIIHLSPPSAHAVTRSTHGEYWNPMKVVVLVVAAFVHTTALLGPATWLRGRLAHGPDREP
jgi:hypothetical protein